MGLLISGAGYAQGLDAGELAEFSAAFSRYYRPATRADRDAVERAIRVLAETVYGEPIPEGIPPIVILSNWNERPERTQADVLDAYSAALARVEGMLEADRAKSFCAAGAVIQAGRAAQLANTAANLTTAGLLAYNIYSYEPPKDGQLPVTILRSSCTEAAGCAVRGAVQNGQKGNSPGSSLPHEGQVVTNRVYGVGRRASRVLPAQVLAERPRAIPPTTSREATAKHAGRGLAPTAIVAVPLSLFYRQPLAEAWRRADIAKPS